VISTDWRIRVQGLAAQWSASQSVRAELDSEQWSQSLARVRAMYLRLIEEGKWVSGPSDLMTVLGATHDELSHSRVLAWLLEPTGRHRLGGSILRRVLQAGWPRSPVPDLGAATVGREVPRQDEIGASRADVVVWVGPTVLVIENKVGASESDGQCETLYQHWAGEAEDVRFLLLSKGGHLPVSTISDDARVAWRAMSYGHLAGLLAELAGGPNDQDAARVAVRQYREALVHLVGAPTTFAITSRSQ
jgi:hypothetical protein